jgi:exopolysaccharide biosynthesis polyprenyl glycosylphosphotransferase
MRRLFFQQHQKYRLLLLIGDLIVIIGSLSLIFYLETNDKQGFSWDISKIIAVYFIIPAITMSVFYILGLYDLSKPKFSGIILLSICIGLWIVMIFYSSLSYFIILLRPGKINLILFMLIIVVFTFAWRLLYNKLINIKPQRLLFVGKEPIIIDIQKIIQSHYCIYYAIEGHWHSHSHNPTLPNLLNFIEEHHIDTIVYSVHSEVAKQISNDLITIQFGNTNIMNAYTFYQQLTRKYPVYFLDDFWLLVNAQREIFFPAIASRIKRAFDILFVLLLLPPALAVLLMSALAIKLDSAGPSLFIQERLGQNEKPFRLYKLRTMIDHAEAPTGPQWSGANDPRITRVGKLLRKLRLDELPQLFNVLKGDMGVVGPRPIRKYFADILAQEVPYYRLRFLAKPGLTGWAQVNCGYAGSNEGQSEKLQYDLFYLVHQSMRLDLLILLQTIKVMVWGKGT